MDKIKELKTWLSQGYGLIVIKDGQIIFKSKEHGIKALFRLIKESPGILVGTTVLDKRIGRAAALLLVLGRVKDVVTLCLSSVGEEVFVEYNIKFLAQEVVQHILNENSQTICPFEKLATKREPYIFYKLLLDKKCFIGS